MSYTILSLAFFLSTLFQYAIQKIFIYYKRFDDFNNRSFHITSATRTGGIGIFSALVFISIYYYFEKTYIFDYSLIIPLSIMFIVGVYDDLYNADFKLKFLLQIVVAKILIDQGYFIENYYGFLGLYEIPWVLSQISTVFVFLIIVNSINFIDGTDGLAITQVIKTILYIELFSSNVTELASLGTLFIILILPMYYFNFKNKEKVFLGDGGSLLLGSLIAIYVFYLLGSNYTFKENFEINKTLFSVMVVFYPLVDLLRIFSIRIKNRKSPFVADQNHLHHFIKKRFGLNHFGVLISITLSEILIFISFLLVYTNF